MKSEGIADKTFGEKIEYDPTLWENHLDYDLDEHLDERIFSISPVQKKILDTFLSSYNDGDKILDVGCAGGHYYRTLSRLVSNLDYTGVDITPGYIEIARKKFPGATFIVADVRDMPFSDSCFDMTLCLSLLMHIGEGGVCDAMRELTRITKKKLLLSGYFSDQRLCGSQKTGKDKFVFDFVSLKELEMPGWRVFNLHDVKFIDMPGKICYLFAEMEKI